MGWPINLEIISGYGKKFAAHVANGIIFSFFAALALGIFGPYYPINIHQGKYSNIADWYEENGRYKGTDALLEKSWLVFVGVFAQPILEPVLFGWEVANIDNSPLFTRWPVKVETNN